jgi:hypothetical protein
VGAPCGRPRAPIGSTNLKESLAAFLVVVSLVAGCREEQRPRGSTSQSLQAQFRQADRGRTLLEAAGAQLADLPSAVDTALRPPSVIIDSTKSSNRADIQAVCLANPQAKGPPQYTIIQVPSGNARFRSLDVQPGDVIKYYVREDETVDEQSNKEGLSRQIAIDLKVAQVIDENTLLLEKGLSPNVVRDRLERMSRVLNDESLRSAATLATGMVVPAKIEIWRYADDRLLEVNRQLREYMTRRLPPLGWEPSPDYKVLEQIAGWLNQWVRQSAPKDDWQREPLVGGVQKIFAADEKLRTYISDDALAAQAFEPYDSRLLQEAIWLRDISRWAQAANGDVGSPAIGFTPSVWWLWQSSGAAGNTRWTAAAAWSEWLGETSRALARAAALFDWTIRNVQLDADESATPHRPGQALMFGHGTAEQRAWIFALLCRHQRLSPMILVLPEEGAGKAQQFSDGTQMWAVGVLAGGQVFLFDTRLGLPVSGPGGQGIATLAQALADDAVLRQLDVENAPYPVTADALKAVEARIVADPFDLSRRAAQVQANLAGNNQVILTANARELAAALEGVGGVQGVALWDFPFRTLRDQLSVGLAARETDALAFEPFAVRPKLWKARTRHFQGRRFESKEMKGEITDDHQEATSLYIDKSVRPTYREIANVTSPAQRRVEEKSKLNATYWLGLLAFDEGQFEVAAHWFSRPEITGAESSWNAGARYNLARTLAAQNKLAEAIELLEADTSPQQHGNKVLARQWKQRLETANK